MTITRSSRTLVCLEDVAVGYPGHPLFSVSMTLSAGEWVAIAGPNGSGKSTLLKTLAGIIPVFSGTRKIWAAFSGYVPQRFTPSAASPLTTFEFINLKPQLTRTRSTRQMSDVVMALDLMEFLHLPLRELSGGQLQRALFAFACLGDPPILFLDEALEGIDLKTKSRVCEFLQLKRQANGLCVVEVTHDLAGITEHAERVVMMSHGVVFDGDPKDERFHNCIHTVYGRKIRIEDSGRA